MPVGIGKGASGHDPGVGVAEILYSLESSRVVFADTESVWCGLIRHWLAKTGTIIMRARSISLVTGGAVEFVPFIKYNGVRWRSVAYSQFSQFAANQSTTSYSFKFHSNIGSSLLTNPYHGSNTAYQSYFLSK